MKTLKYFLSAILLITFVWGCEDDDFGSVDFVSTVVAPTNVTALYNITQDNTGFVTITPNSEGATSYDIYFGDSATEAANVKQGGTTTHTYAEGTYSVKIVAKGVTGLTTEVTQELVVSFKAPENLEVTIENDLAVSKQVNVTATADYAASFDVYFGEEGNDEPVIANIGDMVSYTYAEAGIYTIRVVAKGAAITTTEYTVDFEATAILQPITSAPTPPVRGDVDVISIYGDAYTNVAGTNYNPDWGQSGQGSSFAEFDLNGDKMLQYINLSYQGIGIGETIDVSAMEFLHMDVWTANVTAMETSLINGQDGNSTEAPVWSDLTADQWTSIDIPISDYIDQGLTVNEIFQLKLVGEPWAGGTVFVDNIYFHRAPSTPVILPLKFDNDGESFGTFNGASFVIDTDPEDASNPVGMITNSGNDWEGISLGLDEAVDLSVNKQIKLDFYSTTTGNTVLFKFENGTDNPVEVSQTVTQTGWSELIFDFSTANYSWPNSGAVDAFGAYSTIVMFVDGGQFTPGTYYIDNVEQVGTTPQSNVTPITFEFPFEVSSFDGGDISVVSNPDSNGNTSAMVSKLVKGAGQTWAGSKITVPNPFSFGSNTTVTVKVWSPRVGLNLLIKFEDVTPWPNTVASAEVVGTTTLANQWEELIFDFSGIDTSVDFMNLVLIMDNGTAGDGSSDYTVYVDDISIESFLDFENEFKLSSFDGGDISVVSNPDSNGNTSAMVSKLVKGAGQTWAGSKITVLEPFSFSSTTVTVKVYSPRVGLNLLMKFEDTTPWPNTVASAEVVGTTTVANQWEELTFNFSGIDTSVDFMNLVLIMDNGTAGDGSSDYTMYIDDIAQN